MQQATNKRFYESPPQAKPAVPGAVASIPVGAVAKFVDLQSIGIAASVNGESSSSTADEKGSTDGYVTFFADGADVYVIFGPDAASVSGGNVPVIAQDGTVDAGTGVYTAHAGTAYKIPSGAKERWYVPNATSRFMGHIASGAGHLRTFKSNPGGM